MKTMKCRELGGACEKSFSAHTFEEIAELSKQHGMDMFKLQDPAHLKAMEDMRQLMSNPNAMTEWFEEKKKLFESLPDD